MKKLNKKGVTLLEIVIVIAIIMFLLSQVTTNSIVGLGRILEVQNIKNFLVNETQKVKMYSYNNVTLGQELTKEVGSTLKTNTEISRYDQAADMTNTSSNKNSKLAYYHSLYLTTNPVDDVNYDLLLNPIGTLAANGYVYVVQYRQQGYQGNKKNRDLEPLDLRLNGALLLKGNSNFKWSSREKYPSLNNYYLNKIVDHLDSCKTGVSLGTVFQVLYTSNNLSYQAYLDQVYKPKFDYKFCFSEDPTTYEERTGFSLRLNVATLTQYYFETLESNNSL